MYYSAAIVAFFITSMAPTTSAGLSAEAIKDVIGDGCVNNIKYNSSFKTDTGDTCSTCTFCDGSDLSSLFDPTVENACVDCGVADNDCNTLEIVTEFENPWPMNFITLTSSTMNADNDPFKIIIKASNDSNTWETINESDLAFVERKKEHIVFFNNNQKHKIYSILLRRKSTSKKIYLGQYGLVDSYTKACAANLYKGITGDNSLSHYSKYIGEPGDIILSNGLKGTKIDTINNPSNYFALSFKLYLWEIVNDLAEVLRFTATSHNCCDYSDRWLMMNIRSDTNKMAFVAGSTTDPNAKKTTTNAVKFKEWNDFRVEALGDIITLYINGVEEGQLPNTDRTLLEKLDVYAGTNHYTSPNGVIRDYQFTPILCSNDRRSICTGVSFRPPTIIPSRDNLIDTITNPPSQYIISFTLHPLQTVARSNIIRFTSTTNNCCVKYGDRVPIIDFLDNTYDMLFVHGRTNSINQHQTDIKGVVGNEDNKIKMVSSETGIVLYVNDQVRVTFLSGLDKRPPQEKFFVYASDKFRDPANAKISNFYFSHLTTA